MQELWPHQTQAVLDTLSAIDAGWGRVLLTSPTGGGKTRIACELIERWLREGLRVAVYTNRRLLIDQLSGVLARHGIDHGIRANGHASDLYKDVQICSVQTENSRSLGKRQSWQLHKADRVIVDEAHLNKEATMQTILGAHRAEGAAYVGLTATPLDLAGLYDVLVQAGTNSGLRGCGALVPCVHYAPDEPDLRHVGKVQVGHDLSENQNVKAMMVEGVFGRVLDWLRKINPEQKPSILFAPGVKESVWFAEQFSAAGIPAAHIDGQEVWHEGKFYRTSPEARQAALDGSKGGAVRVLCNRFVLREGIDAPWLAHGIFATVFGSLQSYLQSGGRLLRSCPGLTAVTLQDHGGNWWRHGSLNADRTWKLGDTAASVMHDRSDSFFHPDPAGPAPPKEPLVCPQCARVLVGPRCIGCGFEIKPGCKSRMVVQHDGSLIEMRGDVFIPRAPYRATNGPELWRRMYYRARNAGMTFRQAESLFAAENNWRWPDRAWPLTPLERYDWNLKVVDLPREKLR